MIVSRILLFTVLPVLTAALYIHVDGSTRTRRARAEVALVYLLAFSGANGISGFVGHTALADTTADAIGWSSGSPFQQEVAVANLVLAVLAFVAISRTVDFRAATVLALVVWGLGTSAIHLWDIAQNDNWAAGNSVQVIGNLLRPALLVLALRATRDLDDELVSSSHWHAGVVASAMWSTACAGAAFGLGYGIGSTGFGAAAGTTGALVASWVFATRARQAPIASPDG